jgi:GT2 family glycosyltransferase
LKIAVVILNWNGRKFLETFLPSVIQHSSEAEIIIADNASTDDSLSFLSQSYPQLRQIRLGKNLGYSAGYNAALRQIEAEYYVLLNSDIEVTEGWLRPVIELMDNDLSIAACQPKIRSYHQRDEFEYAGAAGGFIDKLGYPFCRGRIFDSIEKDLGQYDVTDEIFWATGACLFARSSAYWEVGGLDDDFFAHLEEIDLCWRLKNKGYKIYYCHSSLVFHVGGGTLHKTNPHKTYLNFRNSLYMLYKNLERKYLLRVIFLRLILDGIAGVKFMTDSFKHTWAIVRAHFSFYGKIGMLQKKRNELLKNNLGHTGVYKGWIINAYYLKGIKTFSKLNLK